MSKPRGKSFYPNKVPPSHLEDGTFPEIPKNLNILRETAQTVAENLISQGARGVKTEGVQRNIKKKVLRIFKKNQPSDQEIQKIHLEHLGTTIQDHVRQAGDLYSMARELGLERNFLGRLPEEPLKEYISLYHEHKQETINLHLKLDVGMKELAPTLNKFKKNTPRKDSTPSKAEMKSFYRSKADVYNGLLALIQDLCYVPLEKNIAPVLPGVFAHKFRKFLLKHRLHDLVWGNVETDTRSGYGVETILRGLFAEAYAKTFFNENPIKTLYFQEVHLSDEDHKALDVFHETDLLYRVTTSTGVDMIWGIDVKNREKRAMWRIEAGHVEGIRRKLKTQSEQSLSRLPLYSLCFGVGLGNNFHDLVWTPKSLSDSYCELAEDLHRRRSIYEKKLQQDQ